MKEWTRPKWMRHLHTINHHKWLVMKHCFALGLYRQGLWHDLSKYSPAEFIPGVKYYTGKSSPHNGERADLGYSGAWLHHKGRNKHHMEYWIDYAPGSGEKMSGMRMPERYVVEMFCDRLAACENYHGKNYQDRDPYDYYMKSKDHYIIHPETRALLEKLLFMLKDEGKEKTFSYIREKVLKQV